MKKILAIVGMPGSGKTEAADYFRAKNISVIRFGDITDEGLEQQGLPLNEGNERIYREKLRQELGMEAYAIKIAPRIAQALVSSNIIVLDGLRSWEEYEYLVNHDFNVSLLNIYAAPSIRYNRLIERKKRSLDIKEAKQRDVHELIALNMGAPIAMADYFICNETTKDYLHNNLDKIWEEINK